MIVFLLSAVSLTKAAEQWGGTYTRNYNKKEYKGQPQNWAVLEDKQGFIRVANQGSLLTYDGVSWHETLIPGKSIRSLALAPTGTLFVGGVNEIGAIHADETVNPHYVSLTGLIPQQYRQFGPVWKIHVTDEGTCFCSSKYLFLFKEEGHVPTVIPAQTSFSPPLLCKGKLCVRQNGVGLSVLKDGILHPLPWGNIFSTQSIYLIAPTQPGSLVVGARPTGFMSYRDGILTAIQSPWVKQAQESYILCARQLSNGHIAVGTRKSGLFIFDSQGRLNQRFDTSNGLPDNNIYDIFQDSRGNLWLAQVNWISKIEYPCPFSFYDRRHNLPGMVINVSRHGPDHRLYACTNSGVFVMNEYRNFEALPGIPGKCYDLLSIHQCLLAATDYGIFCVKSNPKNPLKISPLPAFVFHPVQNHSGLILAGTGNGMRTLALSPKTGQWSVLPFLPEITGEIRTIAEDEEKGLWIASPIKGVIKITNPANPRFRMFDTSHFANFGQIQVFFAGGHIIVATSGGLFKWDKAKDTFVPDTTLGDGFAGGENSRGVKLIRQDHSQRIWFHSKGRNLLAVPQTRGRYRIYEKKFLRIPLNPVNAIYPDPDEPAVWLASAAGLIRIDTNTSFEHRISFPIYIRNVSANGVPIYSRNQPPVLPFDQRNLRFTFAAPFYGAEEQTLYRCRLQGYDRDWTPWSKETRKDYTNLEPGFNVFRVQAKNVYGDISEEAAFRFKLLPPWYRTWWAYSTYIFCVLLAVWGLVKWRSAQLMKEKKRLEDIVARRTREINRKNKQLQEMAGIKSRFFANISHEFRTPLTLILGPLEQMIDDTCPSGIQSKYKLMRRNAQRLLNLINQLLELSKLDSGNITLNATPQDIVVFLEGLTASFEPLTTRKEQELLFRSGEKEIVVYFDITRMEEVFCNLLSNAVKFTPGGGRVVVSVNKYAPESPRFPRFPNGYAEIEVTNTGPSIPPDRVEKIFQRFYYSEYSGETNQKGTGIGLSIAKEWVELHHGTIHVTPREEGGNIFTVRLPMGKSHLEPHEITEISRDEHDSLHRLDRYLPEEIQEKGPETGVIEPFTGEEEIILLVEDNADLCHYIRAALEPQFKVIEARNGALGMEKARQVIPDLIISDIMMPGTDGIELCRTLKQDRTTCHIPIILLTAKASEENVLEGLDTGADDYITKPFSIRILCARIKNLIELRRQLQLNHQREMTLHPVKTQVSSLDREFFKDLHTVIETNLDDTDFGVEQLAEKLYMGRATVYRKIAALCGEPPSDYIRSYRLKKAVQFLKNKDMSITQVALEVGFSSSTYFTKCFKEKFHQLPSYFRKNH